MTHKHNFSSIKLATVSYFFIDTGKLEPAPMAAMQNRSWAGLRLGFLFVMLLTVLATESISFSQVLYGSVTGNVMDASGAALPGAQVTAVNSQTGDKNVQTSDSAGIDRFPAL